MIQIFTYIYNKSENVEKISDKFSEVDEKVVYERKTEIKTHIACVWKREMLNESTLLMVRRRIEYS